MADPEDTIHVAAADPAYRAGPIATLLYDQVGLMFEDFSKALDRSMIFSVILSRVTRELRRHVGVEGAKQVLQGLIDTMDDAAKGDLPAEPPEQASSE